MASLDLRVLVLERLSRKWIVNDSGGGSGTGGEPGPGAGQVGAVAFWKSGTGLTYDAPFHYDDTNNWLGLGAATPTAPLTFAQAEGQKIHLWASGTTRYGLGIAAGTLQIYSQAGGSLQLGTMSTADGVTFTPHLVVSDTGVSVPNVPVGLSTPAVAGYALRVGPYHTFFGGIVGIGYEPTVAGVWLKSGTAIMDAVRLGGGLAAARWPLDCPSQGHVLQLGVYYGPDNAAARGVDFTTRLAQIDQLGLGYPATAGYTLRAGGVWVDGLYIAGGYDSRWNFVNWGTSYFNSTCQFQGQTGFGYAPLAGHNISAGTVSVDYLGAWGVTDARFKIRCYGDIYCDGVPYLPAGGPWVTYSDRRMKRNVQEIPHPLETMTRLHGVLYEFTDTDDGKPAGLRMGVIAQEVEEVLPTWVGELDGMKTTQLSRFEALAIESFKTLAARVAALEEQLACP